MCADKSVRSCESRIEAVKLPACQSNSNIIDHAVRVRACAYHIGGTELLAACGKAGHIAPVPKGSEARVAHGQSIRQNLSRRNHCYRCKGRVRKPSLLRARIRYLSSAALRSASPQTRDAASRQS
eukprot:6212921-Pleurochrysis_carterae.AAC.1